jgi:hypothetical protein
MGVHARLNLSTVDTKLHDVVVYSARSRPPPRARFPVSKRAGYSLLFAVYSQRVIPVAFHPKHRSLIAQIQGYIGLEVESPIDSLSLTTQRHGHVELSGGLSYEPAGIEDYRQIWKVTRIAAERLDLANDFHGSLQPS